MKGLIISKENALATDQERFMYQALKQSGNVEVLTIDQSWTPYLTVTDINEDGRDAWNRLLAAAENVPEGLLVLQVSNIQLFSHCWKLKQLAKQDENDEYCYWPDGTGIEEHSFRFHGRVLIELDGLTWKQVSDYAREENCGEFEAMCQFY